MSTAIEERVVSMRFDNSQFEKAAEKSMSTLDKLKAKLNFQGASKGLDELSAAADDFSLAHLGDETDSIGLKFDAMAIVAITALQRITNAAMTAGINMAKSLTITPVFQGFSEYELKLNSVQTIMNSTGESLETVNAYLDELNTYADRTIYSFSDMTSNIGKFTNAGVKLEDAVKAIQGVSNEAALSGANANEASRAMYNFAQALSSGAVRLIDWKSIENANMATVEFKEELLKTALALGTVREQDGKYISTTTDLLGRVSDAFDATSMFNDSLSAQWLTTDVLVQTLGRYADETTELGKRAYAAAQDVKTFTQLMDTLQEAVGSGWAQTWEIIFGDFGEAKELWTSVSNVVGGFVDAQADARNEMLQGWKDLGGRVAVIDTISAAFTNLTNVISALKRGFEDIFPPITAEQLYNATKAVQSFVESLKLSDEAINTLRITFKALLLPVKLVVAAIEVGIYWFGKFVQAAFRFGDALLALPSKIGSVDDPLRKLFGDDRYERIVSALTTIMEKLGSVLGRVGAAVSDLVKNFTSLSRSSLIDALQKLAQVLSPLGEWLLDKVVAGIEAIANADYSKIVGWATVAINSLRIGFSSLGEIIQNGIELTKRFFAQFEITSPVDVLKGMLGALQAFGEGVWEFIKSLGGEKIIEGVSSATNRFAAVIINLAEAVQTLMSKLSPGKILVFSFGATLVYMVKQIGDAFKAFGEIGESVAGMFKSVSGVFDALKERIKPNLLQKMSGSIIQFAVALTIMAAALFLVSKIDGDRLWVSFGALSALVGVFAAFATLMTVLNSTLIKTPETAKNLMILGMSLMAMTASIAILSEALYTLSQIDTEGIGVKLLIMGAAIATLVGASIIVGKHSKDLAKSAAFIIAFSGSMLLIVRALKVLGEVDLTDSLANVTIVLTVMAALAIVSRLMTQTTKTIGKDRTRTSSMQGLTAMIIDLVLLAGALKLLSMMDTANLITGLINMIPIFGAILAISLVTRAAGSASKKMGTQLLAISASIVILSFAIERIGNIDKTVVDRGMGVVAALMLLFGALIVLGKIGSSSSVKMGSTFLSMSAAILILGLAIDYIGHLDLNAVIQGTIVVGVLLTLFGGLMAVSSLVGQAKGTITVMTVAIGLLVASLALLTLLDFKELMGASAALSLVLTAFGVCLKLIGGLKISSAIGSILVLLTAVSILGLAFKYLENTNPESVLGAATGMAEVLLALGLCMTLLRGQRAQNNVALSVVGTVALILAELTAVVLALSVMPAGENLIQKATAMSEILLALSGAMVILGKAEAPSGLAKTLITMTALLAEAMIVTALLTMIPADDNLIKKATALSIILVAMAGVMAIISAIGSGLAMLGSVAGPALIGAGAAELIILSLIALVELVGFAFSEIDALETYLEMAENVLPRIGLVIGEFIGNLVGGFVGGTIGGAIEAFGTSLSNFANNVQDFLALDVKEETVDSIGRLAAIAALVTGATFLDAIARFGSGESSMEAFGAQLSAFGPYFADFAESIADIPQRAVTVSATCLEALANVLATIPTDGGIMGMIFGNQDISAFGKGLVTLAKGIADYATVLDESDVSADTVTITNTLTKTLINLANSVPKTGGLVSFLGAHDIGAFGDQLVDFGEGLSKFIDSISHISLDPEKLDAVAKYGTMLVGLANDVPKTGALVDFLGGHDIGAFGDQLVEFASGLVSFLRKINLVSIKQEQVEAAKKAGETMVALAETVPKSGALITFFGGKDIGTFGEQIGQFGSGLGGFFSALNSVGLNQAKIELAKDAGLAFTEIADAVGTNTGLATLFEGTSLKTFGEQIKGLGDSLAGYYISVQDISWETVTSSIDQLNRILTLIPLMADVKPSETSNFTTFLVNMAASGVREFTEAFRNAEDDLRQGVIDAINAAFDSAKNNLNLYSTSYTVLVDALVAGVDAHSGQLINKAREICAMFTQAIHDEQKLLEGSGTFVIISLIVGIQTSEDQLTVTVVSVMEGMLDSMNTALGIRGTYSTKFQNAGESCINGLVKGIDSKKSSVLTRMTQLGNDILSTFRETVGWHSPWESLVEAGQDAVSGLITGIGDNAPDLLDFVGDFGGDILGEFGDVLDINNGISYEGMDLGASLDLGIADGLLENEYAYSAASTMADGILDIFKDRFSNISDAMSILDQEFELWAAQNPVSSYSNGVNTYMFGQGQYTQQQFELLNNKLLLQAEQVNMANASYQANLAKFGENATETRQAYSSYLEAQISMANLTQQMDDLQRTNRTLFQNYAQVLGDVYDDMRAQGFSDEEIKSAVSDQTGWVDMSKVANTNVANLMDIYTQQATSVESLVTEAMTSATANTATVAKSSGTQAVQSFSEGIVEAAPQVQNAVQSVTNTATESVPSTLNERGVESSKSWFDGLLDGASSAIDAWKDSMMGAATAGDQAFRTAAEIASPSQVMYRNGVYFIEGLTTGIESAVPSAISVAAEAAANILAQFQSKIGDYQTIGSQMMTGLAGGIASGASAVVSAAANVAAQAIAAAQSVLGIHSPSREYYEIGEMMDQGLANGIIDNASIVESAIQQMLSGVQSTINSSDLYIRPVIEDGGSWSGSDSGSSSYKPKVTNYTQLLQWDANGNLIPVGMQHTGWNQEDSRWAILDAETANAIRYLGDVEAERLAYEKANQGLYQGTVEELKSAIQSLADNPGTTTFTQNNYSPTALSTGDIYRETKSAISTIKLTSFPSGAAPLIPASSTISSSITLKPGGSIVV